MTSYQQILYCLEHKQLNKAIDLLRILVVQTRLGIFSDRIEDIQTNYNLLLKYFRQNITDPHRQEIYAKLTRELYCLTEEAYCVIQQRNSNQYYYIQIRDFKENEAIKPASLLQNLTDFNDGILPRNTYEQTLSNIFDLFWLSTTYTNDVCKCYTSLMQASDAHYQAKCLAVTALTLNIWQHFSDEKIDLLLNTCLETTGYMQQRALVGLWFVLAAYNKRLTYFPQITAKITLLKEQSDVLRKMEQIIIQIIRTEETEDISQKLQDEIIPEMLRANTKLKDKLRLDSFIKAEDISEPNPEWSDFLEESGISKKLQEFSEMQMSGADVYMGTFATLKDLPFFYQAHHWFLPFDQQYSTIASLFSGNDSNMLSTFIKSNVLCNSDKYSFCLAIMQFPQAQQNMMKSSLNAEMEQINEQITEDLTLRRQEAQISNQYIQDLYRFFKLYRHRNEMNDMFAYTLKMHKTILFETLFTDKQVQLNIANFYFSKKCYSQALEMFVNLETQMPTAEIFQKMGYSYQQLQQLDKAMCAYERADLIAPDNVWTLKRMAACSRMQGNVEKALQYYLAVDKLKPDDIKNELNVGLCYMEMKQYNEALHIYYKLDIERPDTCEVWKALAWCSFIAGKNEQSEKYWQKVLRLQPQAQDYLNAAHNAFCMNKREQAIDLYKQSKAKSKTVNEFWNIFQNDREYLLEQGISSDDITLLMECI